MAAPGARQTALNQNLADVFAIDADVSERSSVYVCPSALQLHRRVGNKANHFIFGAFACGSLG
jgi:hypothetical protein